MVFALLLFALQDSIIKGLSQPYPLLQVRSFGSGIVPTLLVASGLYLQGRGILRGRNPLPFFSAMCYALIPIINRRIGMSEHALTMAIYTTFTYLSLILLAPALIRLFPVDTTGGGIKAAVFQRWLWLSADDLRLTLRADCIFSGALLCITQAYRIAIVGNVPLRMFLPAVSDGRRLPFLRRRSRESVNFRRWHGLAVRLLRHLS